MTISIDQQVDYLWKKVGYGLAKTSTVNIKDATNESIPSFLFLPGDKIWAQSGDIPFIQPAATTSIVKVYNDLSGSTVKCIRDVTAPANRTWLTSQTDWIPPIVGPTYQPKVYLDSSDSITPQTTGIQLYGAGSDNNDEWFFDFQSGVLHFIGDNLPNHDFTNKSIFIAGARYVGLRGFNSTSGSFGNMTIDGNVISSSGTIILVPADNNISVHDSVISNVAYPVSNSDAASVQYVLDTLGGISPNKISQGNSDVTVLDTGIGNVSVTVDGNNIATFTPTSANFGSIGISGETISSSSTLILSPNNGIASVNSSGALQVSVGSTGERPVSSLPGFLRYNTTTNGMEFFNGNDWINTVPSISSQLIVGDAVTTTFDLDKPADTKSMLVMINGVVQIPDTAYTVSNAQITFAEPPLPSETVEIRYIAQLISSLSSLPNPVVVDSLNMPVDTAGSIIDMFSVVAYRSARYSISASTGDGEFQLFDYLVVHNGITALGTVNGFVRTGGAESVELSVSIQSNTCIVMAVASHINTQLKIQKTYFTI